MSTTTARADARTLPEKTDRRAVLRSILAGAAGAIASAPAVASAVIPENTDAELIALADEIRRIGALRDEIQATRIDPYEEKFSELIQDAARAARSDPGRWEELSAPAWDYSRETGRTAAGEELEAVDDEGDRVWRRMVAIPAATQVGRAAKVRALLTNVCSASNWHGDAKDLDWDIEQTRALLGEFAGLGEDELAAI
jgi:hypothetical protein